MKKFIINCEVYKVELHCWIGGTEKEFVEEANKEFKAGLIEDGCLGIYIAIYEGNSNKIKHRILWIEKEPKTISDRAVMVHELMHAVLNILSHRNIRLLTDEAYVYKGTSEEPFAYLLEFFYREFFNKLNEAKHKHGHNPKRVVAEIKKKC